MMLTKVFFDVIVQLKEIDPEAYYKILKELGYMMIKKPSYVVLVERSKKNFKSKKRIERRNTSYK